MRTYGQYCPIARGAEIFAERWTPLIIRRGARRVGSPWKGSWPGLVGQVATVTAAVPQAAGTVVQCMSDHRRTSPLSGALLPSH